jgi:hemerythrin-like domain-containing protein
MSEHRVIERMIRSMRRELDSIGSGYSPDYLFLLDAVDFLQNYADRCHHGKEEGILFRELSKKQLSPELAGIMAELIEEHKAARANVRRLQEAVRSGINGAPRPEDLRESMAALIDSYPKHIQKEDKRFFIPAMGYFSEQEQAAMLAESERFETGLLHQIYHEMVKGYEGR